MSITIESALSVCGQGTRENNEDSLYPPPGEASSELNLFIICDGVGGEEYGELASQLTCAEFANYFVRINPVAVSDEAYIRQALDHVQERFDTFLTDHPEAKKMATTLSLLHVHERGVTVAHIGDSRVYHIQKGKISWRTEDHLLINDYLKEGIIKPEEAATHPYRHTISRAIQDGAQKKAKPDVTVIPTERLEVGDYFMLFSDGVLEALTDSEIEAVLAGDQTEAEKIETIRLTCLEKSSDNYTAFLVKLGLVSLPEAYSEHAELAPNILADEPAFSMLSDSAIDKSFVSKSIILPKDLLAVTVPKEEKLVEHADVNQFINKSKSGNRRLIAVFIGLFFLLALAYYFFK